MGGEDQESHVAEIAKLFPPQGQWTEFKYFMLPDSKHIIELSDGGLIMPPPPSFDHQKAVLELALLLRQHVDAHDLGTVAIAPLAVRLWEGKIREPDVMFFTRGHRERIGQQHCGPPDWVAEVTSPGTRKTDEVDKLAEYARAGIPEYWLVDPENKSVGVYVLRGEDAYTLAETYAPGQEARSEVIEGFEAPVDRLFTV